MCSNLNGIDFHCNQQSNKYIFHEIMWSLKYGSYPCAMEGGGGGRHTLAVIQFEGQCVRSLYFTEDHFEKC